METGKPIPGAIVVVRWEGSISSMVDSQSACFHVETATSDLEGNYRIPRWWSSPRFWLMFGGAAIAEGYKPGFEDVPAREYKASAENVYLQKFAGVDAERFDYISGRVFSGMNCLDAGESRRNLVPLFSAAIKEAKRLALTEQQLRTLEGLREAAAEAWLATPADALAVRNPLANLPHNVREELE